jgi:hypothetical protein
LTRGGIASTLKRMTPLLAPKKTSIAARAKALAALCALFACASASASSARGLVLSIEPIAGSALCALALDDAYLKRRIEFLAEPAVCAQREQWIGRTALFHLSLADMGGRLEPVATRVSAWAPAPLPQ